MAVPSAPTSVHLSAGPGIVSADWSASLSSLPQIDSFRVAYGTSPGSTTNVIDTGSRDLFYTIHDAAPGSTIYFRVAGHNADGYGPYSAESSIAVPARTTLDHVEQASVTLDDGTVVSIRTDGNNGTAPVVTLGYTTFAGGSTFTAIGTISIGGTGQSSRFWFGSGYQNLALAADAAGNLYVVGLAAPGTTNRVLIRKYTRQGPTSWTLVGDPDYAISVPSVAGTRLTTFAAAVARAGATPSLVIIARRSGPVRASRVLGIIVKLNAGGPPYGNVWTSTVTTQPSWLSSPGDANISDQNKGVLSIAPLVPGGSVFAVSTGGLAVVSVSNAVATSVGKSTSGSVPAGFSRARVVGVSSSAFALVYLVGLTLRVRIHNTATTVLGEATLSAADAFGGSFVRQWDALYDTVAGAVRVYYVADSSARQVERRDFSPVTYAFGAIVVETTTLGPASSSNPVLRVPATVGDPDERRVVVESANLSGSTKSVQSILSTAGNLAPNAPTLAPVPVFDATVGTVVGWTFSDPNAGDYQTAYELEVQRVSDSVNVIATGKVVSGSPTRAIAGGVLANGVAYRWRVRTWDLLDAQGAYSAYQDFTPSASGLLNITYPPIDYLPGIDTSYLTLTWEYVQGDGYTQTQRRIRLVRISDEANLFDTGMDATTAMSYDLTGIPSDVEIRVELSIVTNAPGAPNPTTATTRLLLVSYAQPMTPVLELEVGDHFIDVLITNPDPVGSRPEVDYNLVDRRKTEVGGDTWVTIAEAPPDGSYRDFNVAGGVDYDYRVRGVVEE